MAKVTLSFDAVHRTGTKTTSTEFGSYYISEGEQMSTVNDDIELNGREYLYDSTLGEVTLNAGDTIKFTGVLGGSGGNLLLINQHNNKVIELSMVSAARQSFTATETCMFYLGVHSPYHGQSNYYEIVRKESYYAIEPFELKMGDTIKFTNIDDTGSTNPAAGYYAYFENIGTFDDFGGFDADDTCVVVLDHEGKELKVLYSDTETFVATEDCVVYFASVSDNMSITFDVLPYEPLYVTEYTGESGILSWKRKQLGKMRFYLDAGIGYMEVEPTEATQGLRYINMTGIDSLKITSDSEVTECKINEC